MHLAGVLYHWVTRETLSSTPTPPPRFLQWWLSLTLCAQEVVFITMCQVTSVISVFVALWTVALRLHLSMGFSARAAGQAPVASSRDLFPTHRMEPSLTSQLCRQVLFHWHHQTHGFITVGPFFQVSWFALISSRPRTWTTSGYFPHGLVLPSKQAAGNSCQWAYDEGR